jgi:hypothetical protein
MTKDKRSRSRTRSNSGGAKSESHRRGRSNAVVSPVELIAQQIQQDVAHTNTAKGLVQAAEIILEHERPKTTKLTPEDTYKLLNDIWEAAKDNISIEDANKIRTNEAIQRCLTYKLQSSTGEAFLEMVREYYMKNGVISLLTLKEATKITKSVNFITEMKKYEDLAALAEFLSGFSSNTNTIYSTVLMSVKNIFIKNKNPKNGKSSPPLTVNQYINQLTSILESIGKNFTVPLILDEELILDIVQALIFSSSKENILSEIKTVTMKHAPKEIVTTADRRNDLDSFIEKIIMDGDAAHIEERLTYYFRLKLENQERLDEIQKELKRALTIQRHVKAIIAKIDANDKNIGETLHELVQQDSNDRAILKALCGYNEVEGLTNEEIMKISQMAEDSNTRLSKSSYRQSVGTFTSIWDYIRSLLDKIFNNKHKTAFSWEVEKRLAEENKSSEEKSSEEDKRAEEAMDTEANRGKILKEEGAALRETELRKQAEEAEAKAISELQEMGSSLQEDVRSEKALRAEAKAIKELQDMSLNLSEVSTKEELNTPSTEDINREEPPKVSSLIDKFNTLIENHTKAARKFADWKENKNKGTKKE